MDTRIRSTADAVFKKELKANEARTAWQEYESIQAAVDANMMRLRALRHAREATSLTIKQRLRRA